MGTVASIGLDWLVQSHRLDTFVESGTGHGHNLIRALQWPQLTALHSIEIDYPTHHRAAVTFSNEPRVKLYHGDSSQILGAIASELSPQRRVLWYLDAHFAGSGRIEPLAMVVDRDPRELVPLQREVVGLRGRRDLAGDVVIVDDLCLFEVGPYETDAPQLREQLGLQSLGWLDHLFSRTHEISRLTRDGGYWVARPR
jgi:hypothetical protein